MHAPIDFSPDSSTIINATPVRAIFNLPKNPKMSLELFKLHGKTAWITGGSKGLGLQMANALASVGANIVISSRSAAESASAAKKIAETHKVRAIGAAADVIKPAEVQAVVVHAERELGGIDILVNNAGINIRKSTIDMPLEDWQQV